MKKTAAIIAALVFASVADAGYLERYQYSELSNFRKRVSFAMSATAIIVKAESSAIPYHAQRDAFANTVLENGWNQNSISLAVTTNPTIGASIDAVMSAQTWAVGTVYDIGDTVQATAVNGFMYVATVGGTSDLLVEPIWPTVIGETIADGTVTWQCSGPPDSDLQFVIQTEMWNAFSGVSTGP